MNEDFPTENLKLIFKNHSGHSATAECQPSLSIVNSPLWIKFSIEFYIKLRIWISIYSIGAGNLSLLKCNGVVLKTADLGENDKLVWIFSDKMGKISTVAKGAKKSKSKFLSVSLPFCYGEYIVFKGKSLYNLSEGKIIESFQELLNDLTSLTYGSYLCELIDIAVVEEESNSDLFKYFVSTLYMMKTGAVDHEILIRAFELKLLALTGYGMSFESCSLCRRKISSSNYLNLQYQGVVCDDCRKDNGITISRSAYSALKFLNNVPLEKVYRVSLSKGVKDEIYKILSILINNNYSRQPKSLQMLDIFKESEKNE